MSRLDAALRRARGNSSEPDSFEMASDTALDWFDPASAAPPVADMPTNAMPGDATPATDVLLSFPSAPEDDAASPAAPRDVAPETAPSIDSQHAHRLITSQLLRPVTVEQYRRIAAVLHHVQRDRGVKVVMVSSAIPGEGKTLTASNLALTLSQSYQRRVLLIDADLRRPMVHETFGLSNAVGLSNVLDAFEDVAPRFVKVMEHLTVLPAGAPNPDPLSGLTSTRMKGLVTEARGAFDWVIVDTPPVGVLPDANLLGSIVDAALLVVGAGRTPLKIIQQAINGLGRERILGVVLNRVELKNISGHYGGYGGYGYSYGESRSQKRGYLSKS